MIQTSRRSLITGLVSFLAAPAVVRAASLMPVKALTLEEIQQVILQPMVDNLIAIQTVYAGGYKLWITGKDNIIHYEPISNEQFYVTAYDILDK